MRISHSGSKGPVEGGYQKPHDLQDPCVYVDLGGPKSVLPGNSKVPQILGLCLDPQSM